MGHEGKDNLCHMGNLSGEVRMPPKLCSLTQAVSRTIRHKFFRLKFDVGGFPKKVTQREEIFLKERENNIFIIDWMK